MIQAINLQDTFLISKDRITLTEEQMHIPGLRMFGHHTMNSAFHSGMWHYHENSFEFSIPVNGTYSFLTPQKTYQFSAGDVFVSYPNEVHNTNHTAPLPPGKLYWFQLDISNPEHFLFLCPDTAQDLIHKLMDLPHHVIHIGNIKTLPLIEKAFEAIYYENASQLTASYLLLFLHLLLSSAEKNSSHIAPNIQTVLNFIDANLSSDLSLEELADLAALSVSQFKNNFKTALGISPRNYINHKKVEYAKKLLLEGKSVTETAICLNFNSSSYFSTVFKKYTACTPMEFISAHTESGLSR